MTTITQPRHAVFDWIELNGFTTWNEARKTFWIDEHGFTHSIFTDLPDTEEQK